MSFAALTWAATQDTGNMAAKMALLALANWADGDGRAFPSTAALASFGSMDVKTAIAAVARLEALGFISDTGERRGRTRQIKVYALHIDRQLASVEVDAQKPNQKEKSRLNLGSGSDATIVSLAGANASKNGTLPKTEGFQKRNTSVFPGKDTQKRVTDTVRDTVDIDANASIPEEGEAVHPQIEDRPSATLRPEHFVEAWNKLAGRIGKPLIRNLTPERRQKLKARMAEYSIADFQQVLASVERSAFLRGGRFLTFDWIIGKSNFLKVLEGNYDR